MIYEYKLIPLHRQTGEPLLAFEAVEPQITINIEPLCFAMRVARMGEVDLSPIPAIDKTLTARSTAKLFAEMFGANVYWREQGRVHWNMERVG